MSTTDTAPKRLADDIWNTDRSSLDVFFSPRSVALVGASAKEGSVGRTLLWNLLSHSFGGTIFPVNPRHSQVLGIQAYPGVKEIPGQVDLAVIATPASTVPDVIRECADAGVRAAVVISAGFKESGAADLEQQALTEARRGRMRIIGPNCLGVMSPLTGLNATFASSMALPGSVAFLSQSGALCTAVLDWSHQANVGFSAFVSVGSMLDVGWGDLMDHFGNDPRTQSMILYMESIGDARSFLSAAREVALNKPIIVIKAGRTAGGAQAAASHTGALTSSDEVLDAAFRRCGVLRVNRVADLFYMAEALASQPRPKGPRLTILTNAGGPGVLAADTLISNGGELASLSEETLNSLNQILPIHWSHHNPIDMLGDASPERYASAMEIAARDPNSDGLLVILTPQAMTNPLETAQKLTPYAKLGGKPILASWMGGQDIEEGVKCLNSAGIPTFPYPDTAARAFDYMWRYTYNLRGLYETPALPLPPEGNSAGWLAVDKILQAARSAGRTLLNEVESKEILTAYDIPTTTIAVAKSESEAAIAASRMGFPVALKVYSAAITHKTDVGGVHLNLNDEAAVRRAYQAIQASVSEKVGESHFMGVTVQPMIHLDGYEIILGSSVDPQFGPVLLFGMGGQLVEVFKDRALALPPLNTTLARRMMEQTRIFTALQGVRGQKPVDLLALEQLLVRFSELVIEQPWIKEMDINPLLVGPEGFIALDARMVLQDPHTALESLPRPVIRPYPAQYVKSWTMKDGTAVQIRPIRPEDEPLMVRFHETLSDRSIYLRYFGMLNLQKRVSHERLTRLCFIDYDRQMALVAEHQDEETGQREILGVGRLIRIRHTADAEFALLVSDQAQQKGLGSELLRQLIEIAQEEKMRHLKADILPENTDMIQICAHLGFDVTANPEEEVVKAVKEL